MKRRRAVCILQTLAFTQKPELKYTLDGRQHAKTWNCADVISRRIIILELES